MDLKCHESANLYGSVRSYVAVLKWWCSLHNHYGAIINHRRIEQEGNFGLWLTGHI